VLARWGRDILLVDRRLQYGGALVTEELTAPGFYHNLHSIKGAAVTQTLAGNSELAEYGLPDFDITTWLACSSQRARPSRTSENSMRRLRRSSTRHGCTSGSKKSSRTWPRVTSARPNI
jgi:phytoene dehydrogenase-like protein